jgi:hypothetical protein
VRAPGTWWLLLGHSVLIQTVTFALRPATSYRALELGALLVIGRRPASR